MAIDDEEFTVTYVGNNSTSAPYYVTFQYLDPEHIKVRVTPAVGAAQVITAFQLHEGPNPYVTTDNAYPNTTTVEAFRDLPYTQPLVIPEGGRLPSGPLNDAFDRVTMLLQQLRRAVGNALQIPGSSQIGDGVLPGGDGIVGINGGNPAIFSLEVLAALVSGLGDVEIVGNAVFAEATGRLATAPFAAGQLGVQLSDGSVWVGTSTLAGAWLFVAKIGDSVRIDGLEDGVTALETRVDGISLAEESGVVGFETRAELYAELDYDPRTVAVVLNDPVEAKRGTYRKMGSSGSGYWRRSWTDEIARIRALEQNPNLVATVTGPGAPSGSPLATSTQYCVFNIPTPTGSVRKFSLNIDALGDGTFRVHILEPGDNAGDWQSSYSEVVTALGTGTQEYVAGADFAADGLTLFPGEVLAVEAITGGATIQYDNSGGTGYWQASGPISGLTSFSLTAGGRIYTDITTVSDPEKVLKVTGPAYAGSSDATFAAYSLANVAQIVPPGGSARVRRVGVRVKVLGNGTLAIQHLRIPAGGVGAEVVASYAVTALATGVNDFPVDITLRDGEYIGLQVNAAGAQVYCSFSTTGAGYWQRAGIASGGGLSYVFQSPGEIYYTAYYEEYTPPESEAAADVDTLQFELDDVPDFTALPAGWLNETSGWTLTTGKATANTTGKKLRGGRPYALSRRTAAWVMSIGSTSNVITFFTDPLEGANAAGSMFKISAAANTVTIHAKYSGSGSPAALTSALPLGFTMATGKDYLVEWEKNGRSFTIRVQELDGPGYFETTRAVTAVGYITYPGFNYDQGAMHGAPGVMWDSGGGTGPTISSYRHYAKGSKFPRVMIFGDSRTEGFSIQDSQIYAQLIADRIGVNEVQISGIGGATPTSAIPRVQAEIRIVRPEYVMFAFGTNPDGNFVSAMNTLISACQAIGAKIISFTVPRYSSETASTLLFPGQHVQIDKALTASGGGSTPVAGYFANTDFNGSAYNDNIHENATGHARWFARTLADVPKLFR